MSQESIADETRQKLSISTKLRDAESSLQSAEIELSAATEETEKLQQKVGELQSQVWRYLYAFVFQPRRVRYFLISFL